VKLNFGFTAKIWYYVFYLDSATIYGEIKMYIFFNTGHWKSNTG